MIGRRLTGWEAGQIQGAGRRVHGADRQLAEGVDLAPGVIARCVSQASRTRIIRLPGLPGPGVTRNPGFPGWSRSRNNQESRLPRQASQAGITQESRLPGFPGGSQGRVVFPGQGRVVRAG